MTALLLEANGTIKLPKKSLKRYGFEQKTPIRLIETNEGVLLVPLTDQPMSEELRQEIAEWQEASSETWEDFLYEAK
jgi:bifunctional DNA-binding transcriptional regulator/antitoxin component of YhaV-PrlF toxin-antitoxin module